MVQSENISWDEYFMEMAHLVAKKSKDIRTKVGCIVVGPNNEIRTTGYNDFPRGVKDRIPERRERPEKLFFTEHAERAAIYNATRIATTLIGCRLYSTYFPCSDCCRAIIACGIVEVTAPEPNFDNERWGEEFKRSITMFEEAGVIVRYIDIAS